MSHNFADHNLLNRFQLERSLVERTVVRPHGIKACRYLREFRKAITNFLSWLTQDMQLLKVAYSKRQHIFTFIGYADFYINKKQYCEYKCTLENVLRYKQRNVHK